jgi:hypothetical protein
MRVRKDSKADRICPVQKIATQKQCNQSQKKQFPVPNVGTPSAKLLHALIKQLSSHNCTGAPEEMILEQIICIHSLMCGIGDKK